VTRALRVLAPASDEVAEAVRWYDARRLGLARQLFDAVVDAVQAVQANPDMGAPICADGRTRRFLLPRFPHHLVYRLAPAEIVVVAVAHSKRRPGYWRSGR
jgi:plasmid stabilization system protein ParE